MLKIQRSANGEIVFKLIGRMDTEHVNELQKLFKTESHDRPILLDLTDLTLVDGDAVRFLDRCETGGIKPQELPGLHTRVDHETTTRKLTNAAAARRTVHSRGKLGW